MEGIRTERFFLQEKAVLKWIDEPSVYHTGRDDLYDLDDESFAFLKQCASPQGALHERNEFIEYCLKEHILDTRKSLFVHPPIVKSPLPSLRYLELQITDRCNLKCRHCYIGRGGSHELSVGQVRSVLAEFEVLQGLRVLISGGEPLVHRGFEKINHFLPDFRVRKVLFTNGLLLTKEVLHGLNVDEIQISIDGMEKGHDALRGAGGFKRAMEALRLARDSGFDVSVATMVHSGNLGEFDEMGMVFKNLGIGDWTVDVPCATGTLKKNRDLQLSPEVAGKYLKYGFGGGPHGGAEGFCCGLHLLSVLADRRVAKCSFYVDRTLGWIEDGLLACWGRLKPVRLSDLGCDCDLIETCRGGCRFRAETLGDPLGKDLFKCHRYGIL
ncbi:MAG: radical SAM protein [Thermodesulfovibrionales bacterium]|jgi:radical SAM protein with 4Fe4S-binding SPASM domain